MRWTANKRKRYGEHLGDRRVIRGFLFLPRCIEHEWRWLERATIEQRWVLHGTMQFWRDSRWIDEVSVGN